MIPDADDGVGEGVGTGVGLGVGGGGCDSVASPPQPANATNRMSRMKYKTGVSRIAFSLLELQAYAYAIPFFA
jgi:hypothetical protein